jgi:hypothetical protein
MARPRLADADILAQVPAARRRAARALATEPRAAGVRFVRDGRRLVVTLTNGSRFDVPVALVPGLRVAPDAALAGATVGPLGFSLHWDALDEDLSIAGLLRFAVGARTLLRASGAAAGSVRSAAKAAAARRNGRKGGRPRKPAR